MPQWSPGGYIQARAGTERIAACASVRECPPRIGQEWGDERPGRLRRARRAKLSGDSTYVVAALQDPVTRGLAAKYVAAMGATEAVPDLVRMLGAHEPYPRSAAAAALGKLQAQRRSTISARWREATKA